jgi:hypothetical protein
VPPLLLLALMASTALTVSNISLGFEYHSRNSSNEMRPSLFKSASAKHCAA